ncbi:MAG: hypothetical protein JXJ17_08420 [Anaerolineae bacterium]|nr:hypothetical protein [Anaerolineae bacterium]
MFKVKKLNLSILLIAVGLLVACLPVTTVPADSPTAEPSTVELPTVEPTSPPTAPPDESPQYITITSPTDGATLDPAGFTVSGEGGALFEGNVALEVIDADGTVLVIVSTIADSPDAGTGGEGPWSIDLSVDYTGEATLHAFAASPRDGAIVAEDSVSVTFAGS